MDLDENGNKGKKEKTEIVSNIARISREFGYNKTADQ